MTDYRIYKYSKREFVMLLVKSATVIFLISYLFFKNLIISLFLLPLSLLYLKVKKSELKDKRDMIISGQFCDAMQFISSSLSAGKNLEMAFRDSVNELAVLYGSEEEIIIKEFKLIIKKISVNIPLVDALEDFSKRTGNEDIESFKDAIKISRISGGDLIEIVRNVHYVLSLKRDVRNNIESIMAEQNLNFRILTAIPFILMALMTLLCPVYMEPLYTSRGNFVSCLVLLLVLAAWLIGRKINKIEV